ncbi:MAG: TRAP transporter permease [Nitrososphaerales archaeon]
MSETSEFITTRRLKGVPALIFSAIAISMSLYQLSIVVLLIMEHMVRGIHLMFVLLLSFLLYPPFKKFRHSRIVFGLDICLAILSALGILYMLIYFNELIMRNYAPTSTDVFFGLLTIILVLEASRRVVGPALPVLALFMLLYALYGGYIPGFWGHRGLEFDLLIGHMYATTEALFGLPLGVSATFVFLFILLGSFLEKSGMGDFFMKLAMGLVGQARGGPAKIAVVSSALFGTISGSAVANVYGTGVYTIPMMKKLGYKPHFAAAVEAAASTGGQIMPPIMGAAAFIMAEVLGKSYIEIAIAAAIPAILYFISVFFMVHWEAVRTGLRGMRKDELPNLRVVIPKGFHLLIPLIVLVYLLIKGYTVMMAAFICVILALIVSFFRSETRMDIKKILSALEAAARGALIIGTACACAGIVVGGMVFTGLGSKFTDFIIMVSGGNLLIALPLVMIASIILGMGLPTTAAYIMVAVLGAPALIKLGVPPLSAHMFTFYFAIISALTPPVALAAYAGASLAGSDPMKTGFTGTRLALVAFLVPYMFVFNPALLMIGSIPEVILVFITAVLGSIALACSVQGVFFIKTNIFERIALGIASITLIHPGLITDLIGFGLLGMTIFSQKVLRKKA